MRDPVENGGDCDVAVIGFGAAGACAAIESSSCGAQVVVLDRFRGGGATAISGGVVYAGGGTHVQERAGVTDSPQAMLNYLRQEVGEAVSEATLRDFCEASRGNLQWLEAQGVSFDATLCPVKTSYPLDEYYLYYSGNEGFAPYAECAVPAPRGHRAKGRGLPGQQFYEPLRQRVQALGADVRYQSRALSLRTDPSGRVIGVEYASIPTASRWARLHAALARAATKINPYAPQVAKRFRQRLGEIEREHAVRRLLSVRKAVILATGGFVYNREMVEAYAPAYRRGFPLGTTGDDGSGIRLGQSVGGAIARMDRMSAWRFINPPAALVGGVIVDERGRRYVNEQLYGAAVGEAMVERAGGKAFLIIDAAMWKAARAQVGWRKAHWFQTAPALLNLYANCRSADSVSQLAAQCELPCLVETIEEYNAACRSGAPDAFGKSHDARRPIESPRFHMIDCSIDSPRFPCPTLTLGGLVIDERTGHVRDEHGNPIEGLLAAGRTAVGVCSQQYVSGLSLADCVYSARRAARHAVRQQPSGG